jgi:hypothetical protein
VLEQFPQSNNKFSSSYEFLQVLHAATDINYHFFNLKDNLSYLKDWHIKIIENMMMNCYSKVKMEEFKRELQTT